MKQGQLNRYNRNVQLASAKQEGRLSQYSKEQKRKLSNGNKK